MGRHSSLCVDETIHTLSRVCCWIAARTRAFVMVAEGQPRMIALLRKYFTIIVRKYVIGGNAEHPSRNRMKHLAPQMASFLIPDPILI